MYNGVSKISQDKTMIVSRPHLEEKKIANMTLEELKPYACMKAVGHKNDWYMSCVSCPGLNGCSAGKRAVEILEATTKPEDINKPIDRFNNRLGKTKVAARKEFTDVLNKDDPIQYLMTSHNINRKAAKERIRVWVNNYPDILEKHIQDGGKSPIENKKIATYNIDGYNKLRLEGAYDVICKAFESDKDPIEFILDYYGTKRNKARLRLKYYATHYPELEEKYHIMQYLNDSNLRKNEKKEEKKDMPMNVQNDEEVSIEDFLKEMDTEDNPHELQEDISNAVVSSAISNNDILIASSFEQKRKELNAEVERRLDAIKKHEDRIEEIGKQLQALDIVERMMKGG